MSLGQPVQADNLSGDVGSEGPVSREEAQDGRQDLQPQIALDGGDDEQRRPSCKHGDGVQVDAVDAPDVHQDAQHQLPHTGGHGPDRHQRNDADFFNEPLTLSHVFNEEHRGEGPQAEEEDSNAAGRHGLVLQDLVGGLAVRGVRLLLPLDGCHDWSQEAAFLTLHLNQVLGICCRQQLRRGGVGACGDLQVFHCVLLKELLLCAAFQRSLLLEVVSRHVQGPHEACARHQVQRHSADDQQAAVQPVNDYQLVLRGGVDERSKTGTWISRGEHAQRLRTYSRSIIISFPHFPESNVSLLTEQRVQPACSQIRPVQPQPASDGCKCPNDGGRCVVCQQSRATPERG